MLPSCQHDGGGGDGGVDVDADVGVGVAVDADGTAVVADVVVAAAVAAVAAAAAEVAAGAVAAVAVVAANVVVAVVVVVSAAAVFALVAAAVGSAAAAAVLVCRGAGPIRCRRRSLRRGGGIQEAARCRSPSLPRKAPQRIYLPGFRGTSAALPNVFLYFFYCIMLKALKLYRTKVYNGATDIFLAFLNERALCVVGYRPAARGSAVRAAAEQRARVLRAEGTAARRLARAPPRSRRPPRPPAAAAAAAVAVAVATCTPYINVTFYCNSIDFKIRMTRFVAINTNN